MGAPTRAPAFITSGLVPQFDTVAAATSGIINPAVNSIAVASFRGTGTMGRGYWRRFGLSAPAAPISSLCYFKNTVDNYYWIVDTSSGSICPTQIGAAADGTTNDVAAWNAALTLGVTVDGGGFPYGIFDSINMLYDGNVVANAFFTQLDPNRVGGSRTVASSGANNLVVRDIKVNRNGDGSHGDFGNDGAIWISGGNNHLIRRCEVYGDNKTSGGVVLINSTFSRVEDCYVHDMKWIEAGATDDRMQGIWISGCTNTQVSLCTVANLLGDHTGDGSFSKRWTRGFAIAGLTNCIVDSCTVIGTDEAFDHSGGGGTNNHKTQNCFAYQSLTYGFKVVTTNHDILFSDCYAIECGQSGFVCTSPQTTFNPQNVFYVGCVAKDTGSPNSGNSGIWSGSQINGFQFGSNGSLVTYLYPLNIYCKSCFSVDTQATPTQYAAFRSWNIDPDSNHQCTDCFANGFTNYDFIGFTAPYCQSHLSANVTMASGVALDIAWDVNDNDTMGMHDAVSDKTHFVIKQSGNYNIVLNAAVNAISTGSVTYSVIKNDATTPVTLATWIRAASTAGASGNTMTISAYFIKGDTIKISALQSSGSSVSFLAAGSYIDVYRTNNFNWG